MMLRQEIEEFVPFDEVEKEEKEHFLRFIDTFSDVLTRENEFGHFSASCFVVNKARDKVLVVYHNIYKGWVYPGGHADGCEDLLSVALREVEEETGLKVKKATYLFSLPNIYIYSGFPVHTLDMFFLCQVENTSHFEAMDDVADSFFVPLNQINPEEFGLGSIKKGLKRFLKER